MAWKDMIEANGVNVKFSINNSVPVSGKLNCVLDMLFHFAFDARNTNYN